MECVIVCFDVERDGTRVVVLVNDENEFCKLNIDNVVGISIEKVF
jgi:hypothetical protein